MTLRRRATLAAPALLLAPRARAEAGRPTVRVAALRFGSLAWELDVIRTHGLAPGVTLEPAEFAASQATQLALQANRVDLALLDWTWVARQRAVGADWTCAPASSAAGAVVAPPASPVRVLSDLPGRRLGIAGSTLDKSWLILRAHARRTLGVDLDAAVERSFGPPPLLGELLSAGRLDAALTYWPNAARAEATGMRRVLLVGDAAGYVDALTGEGIAAGLAQAEAAVAAVVARRPPDYEAAWRRLTRRHDLLTHGLLGATRLPVVRRAIVPAAARLPWVFETAVDQLARPA